MNIDSEEHEKVFPCIRCLQAASVLDRDESAKVGKSVQHYIMKHSIPLSHSEVSITF